jgi:hypothetical protein
MLSIYNLDSNITYNKLTILSQMSQKHMTEREICQMTNELELLDLYIKVVDQQFRMFILSRLKKVLTTIPNTIYVRSSYLSDTNWAYQEFLLFSLKRNDINKK